MERLYREECDFHDAKTPDRCMRIYSDGFKCFSCGAHGDQVEFAAQMENIPMNDAVKRVAAIGGIDTGISGREAFRRVAERLREKEQKARREDALRKEYTRLCDKRRRLVRTIDAAPPLSDEWCEAKSILPGLEANIDYIFEKLAR